jgi:pilus assembly protein CpaE
VIAVINAKGGSGATFLASNLAHIVAAAIGLRVVALDLDVQFGTLPLYLDLNLRRSLLQALNTIDSLDGLALEAYMTSHASGLHVLGPFPSEMVLPEEVQLKQVRKLLSLVEESYDAIFVDLPRQIDRLTSMVMEDAEQVVVVMQQNVTNLRDSKKLFTLLTRELGIPQHKILVVVNRYQPKNLLTLQDIERTLGCDAPVVIPNDFHNVNESVNTGIPLYETAKSATITKALVKLAERLSGSTVVKKPGLMRRAFSHLGSS